MASWRKERMVRSCTMNYAGAFVLISIGTFLYSWDPDFRTAGLGPEEGMMPMGCI